MDSPSTEGIRRRNIGCEPQTIWYWVKLLKYDTAKTLLQLYRRSIQIRNINNAAINYSCC